jgi:hypothetical protein
MPFVAGESACPSALSRAPGCGVHRSEAKTLAQEKRADQAQGLARKVEKLTSYEKEYFLVLIENGNIFI